MSPISNFGVLAFASAALAVPFAQAHENHRHLHARQDVGSVGGNLPNVTGGSAPSVGGVFKGKRGIAYNDASQALPYVASPLFGWGFNWVSNSAGLSNQVSYIPTLHNDQSTFTSTWAKDAQAAIDAGSEYLFGFNEPDIPSQANLSPQAAAMAWEQYMEPFYMKAKLVAPAVSNSASPGEGLDWLKQFMAACSNCHFDAVNQHWYDTSSNDISYFQQQITQAHEQTGLPVFVGEFGFIGSDSDISESLNQAMGWLDSNPAVVGYAYFMAASGYLNNGNTPSPYGLTYLTG